MKKVRETTLDAHQHQDLPFEHLVDHLKVTRQLNRHPLFQVMFILQNNEKSTLSLEGIKAQMLEVDYPIAKFDLTVGAGELADGRIELGFEYATDLFETTTIERMAWHFEQILKSIVLNPKQKISELQLLTEKEKQQLLVEWNQTETYYPRDKTIHQLFEEQVKRTPENIAVVFEEQTLTFRELNQRANQLAHYLRGLGVNAETMIAISVERSLDLIVGLLGILKAGGAYVPLDPNYPLDRLSYMLEDTKATILITQSTLREKLESLRIHFEKNKGRVLELDREWAEITAVNVELNLETEVNARNLAYVIYTSGSTGKPKGVMIEHKSVVNLLVSLSSKLTISENDKFLQSTSFGFDIAALEIFMPLHKGGRIMLLSQTSHSEDSRAIVELLNKKEITVLQATPSRWQQLIEAGFQPYEELTMLCGGEVLPKQVHAILTKQNVLHHVYGPTETTIWSAHHLLNKEEKISIGSPVNNTCCYILDKNLSHTPVGIQGELYIGGVGVARGYLNRPDLTTERFIENPFLNEAERAEKKVKGEETRLYRTGDLARYLPDGNIEYLGRIDNQVKIRGFRIECGEIESVIRQYEATQETIVIAREDNPNEKRLVAYVVLKENDNRWIQEIRQLIENELPDYMMPSGFVLLDKLPLNPNGKLDRKALPAPTEVYRSDEQAFIAPRTELERQLVGVWSEVLRLEAQKISVTDNFFTLGGNSLLATQCRSRMQQYLGREVPLKLLFDYPTIASLAENLSHHQQELRLPLLTVQSRPKVIPLSFSQQRIWFLEQLLPNTALYSIPVALRLQGSLNREALEKAFKDIISRHESLRTRLVSTLSGMAEQVIVPADDCAFSIEHYDVCGDPEKLGALAREEGLKPFNLQEAPLIRVSLLKHGEESVLLITMHHVASDGWSMEILAKEISEFYNHYAQGTPITLAPLAIQYADYALWQRSWLQGELLNEQLKYWQKKLADIPEELNLPMDRARPKTLSYAGKMHAVVLPRELCIQLRALSQNHQASLFMILLASFNVLLYRYTQQETIVVGSPIANRHHKEVEGLIGFFVNTLALRADLKSDMTFDDLLRQVRETTLGAYQHQDLPFEHLVDHLKVTRQLNRHPLFQVMFVLQNNGQSTLNLEGIKTEILEVDYPTAKFDLTVGAGELADGRIELGFEYATDLFETTTIERMAWHFEQILKSIVLNPKQKISELQLLTENEKQQLLVEWNQTETYYPKDKTIHQLFEEQVEKTPDNVALVFEGQQVTYRELNQKANHLAQNLRSLGVKTEILVAISLERNLDLIVGLLGILKAGGAYVPLDPNYPLERLNYMLQDAKAKILITQSSLREKLEELRQNFEQNGGKVIELDRDWPSLLSINLELQPQTKVNIRNLAYVVYTSGSTGKPKGVLIEHGSLVCRMNNLAEYYGITESDKFLQQASYNFDASYEEIILPLTCGALTVIMPEAIKQDPINFSNFIDHHQINFMTMTPSFFEILVQSGFSGPTLKYLILGGDILKLELAKRIIKEFPHIQFWNVYGPTEATIDASFYRFAQGEDIQKISIGKPFWNTQFYILDESLSSVPIGVQGELFIGGMGLARGYLNQPKLTAERFIENPFLTDQDRAEKKARDIDTRLYRTGDLVRYLADGNIEYLGRTDQQVKIRGFRIECGEIESIIRQHALTKYVAVIAQEDASEDKQLVAYVVPNISPPQNLNQQNIQAIQEDISEQKQLWLQDIQRLVKNQLPAYMMPSHFIELDDLPLNHNGKLNKKALPIPHDYSLGDAAELPPQNLIESRVLMIVKSLVNSKRINLNDNFFHIGGHSLLATKLVGILRNELNIILSIREIFDNSQLSQLANLIQSKIEGHGIEMVQESALEQSSHSHFSKYVMLINPSSSETVPLFLIASGGSHAIEYLPLRNLVPDITIYGITHPAFGDEVWPYQNATQLAEALMGCIKAIRPTGPYIIGGYCFGGELAVLTASIMHAQGDEILNVLCISSHFAHIDRNIVFDDNYIDTALRENNSDKLIGTGSDLETLLKNEIRNVYICKRDILQPPEFPPAYHGKVTLIKCLGEDLEENSMNKIDLFNGFEAYLPNINLFTIRCSHYQAITTKNILKIASLITKSLFMAGNIDSAIDNLSVKERALMLAAYYGDKDLVQILLYQGVELNIADNTLNTALHWAANQGQRDILKLLIQYGANVDSKNNQMQTPAQFAQENGYDLTDEISTTLKVLSSSRFTVFANGNGEELVIDKCGNAFPKFPLYN